MNTTTAYTPLECLLLFQSLAAFGTQDNDFARISELLTNNVLVREGETYDAQRLSAESLRTLYLQLLRDELNGDTQDGGTLATKKRKIQSPSLPSDAHEYGDKLPLLVDRLYARYREYMVKSIRDDEKRYAEIEKDIAEIERGDWDEKILRGDGVTNGIESTSDSSRQRANGASIPKPLPTDPVQETTPVQPEAPREPSQSDTKPEGLAISDVLNNQPNSPQIHGGPRVGPQGNIPPPQRLGSNTPHGPSPLQHNTHPLQPPPPPPQNYGWAPPYQPGHHGPFAPPQPYNPQYPIQYPPHHRPSLPSPHHLPPPYPVPSSPLSSHPQHMQHQHHPNQMPLPQHSGRSPTSPGVPNPLEGPHHPQGQYRANSGSPMMGHGQPGTMQPQYPQQRSPSGNGQYPPAWQSVPMQHGVSYPPNFQQPQYPQPQLQQYQAPPPMVQPISSTYNSPYNPGQGKRPVPGVLKSQPSTPKPSRASFSTGLGTRWTPTPTQLTPGPQTQVKMPAMEPLSPVLKRAALSESTPTVIGRQQKSHLRPPQSEPRGGTITPTAPGGSLRSQSVISHVDELSMDEHNNVKEEVETPSGVDDADDITQPQLLPFQISRHPTKRKRGFSSIDSRSPATPPTHVLWTRAFPKISASALESITGHRNASTFSAPVKERDAQGYKDIVLRPQDLKSIKSAILAGNRAANAAASDDLNPSASSCWLPISEDLIPPKAIINYAQLEKELMRMFANAIMFNLDPDRGIGRNWHSIGKDKGDVVGYEIDEDGVVKETRSMYSDVEKIIGSLRGAERRSEEVRESSMANNLEDDDIDELAGDGESTPSIVGTVSKRRRKN